MPSRRTPSRPSAGAGRRGYTGCRCCWTSSVHAGACVWARRSSCRMPTWSRPRGVTGQTPCSRSVCRRMSSGVHSRVGVYYAGQGACDLLEADAEHGAMLLERVRPGTMLVDLAREDDDRATHVGAEIMRRLWSHPFEPAELQPLREWFETAFARYRAALPGRRALARPPLRACRSLASHLLASSAREVVLHGDVHHFNILQAGREAVARHRSQGYAWRPRLRGRPVSAQS